MHACMCGKSRCVKRTGVDDGVQMLERDWSRRGGPGNWEEEILVQCGLGLWPGQVGVGVWARWNLATVPGALGHARTRSVGVS